MKKIMDVELSTPVAAQLTVRAAEADIPTREYLGILVMAGAYGQQHPEVQAFNRRRNLGINAAETHEPESRRK